MDFITLTQPEFGASARILPGLGFNLFQYQVACGGRQVDVVWADPRFAGGNREPSGSGIPILFPFCGRIEGTRFDYEGRTYRLLEGDRQGNAIHGLVIDRPWRVVRSAGESAVGQFQLSVDDPQKSGSWPTDFRITVEYRLAQGRLACRILVENPSPAPLPFSLGTHPYFHLPPVSGGAADSCRVTVPAARYWELVDLRPTGILQDVDDARDLRQGRPFADCFLDDVLTSLDVDEGRSKSSIIDPTAGIEVTQSFDSQLQHCVVYTPPHREAICMEPYTAAPDALRLDSEGIDAGLRRLPPGESFEVRIEIACRQVGEA